MTYKFKIKLFVQCIDSKTLLPGVSLCILLIYMYILMIDKKKKVDLLIENIGKLYSEAYVGSFKIYAPGRLKNC